MKITEFENLKKYKFDFDDTDTNAVRIRELNDIAKYITPGLNLEFGVFNGVTISTLAKARPDLTFHGFDSFEGLPEDWNMGEKNVNKKAFDRQGNLPEVPDNVKLYKGWFSDTLPDFITECSRLTNTRISFLHVDCDIYSSSIYVLEQLNNFIKPGTIIRFDELCCWRHVFKEASPSGKANRVYYTTWKDHEWKALNEWLEKYDRCVIPVSRNWFQGATLVVTK